MELCSDDHDEICYDGKECPVCSIREELEDYISDLEQELDDIKDGS